MEKAHSKEKSKELKRIIFFTILFLVLLAGAFYSSKLEKTKRGEINFDLYVMSQCPYGTQAEEMVKQAMSGFEDYINFNVEYIATVQDNGEITSLHGPNEIEGDIYQLCVKKYYPDKFWDYLSCQNKNYRDLKSSFESCANQLGINYTTIKACAQNDEGKNLLKQSVKKAKALKVNASPTFYLAGKPYNGPRTKIALQRVFCEELNNQPKICKNLPQDKEFTAYMVVDSRCQKPECQTERLEQQLKNVFSKIKFKKLDYNQQAGKEFYQKYELTYLPAILFEAQVKETDNYNQVANYLKPVKDLYQLAIGAKHDPTKEICDNKQDDTNNGLVDCQDPDCQGALVCRPETSQSLDLFVMSMCPYGTQGMDAMREVLDNFGSNIKFKIHYIAEQDAQGNFRSLHGQPEVDENIRELCAIKYYPENYKYMDYIWCRNKNIKEDWEKCAANFPKIKKCFNSKEGQELLAQNIKLANELNIGASPTWMVNNKYIFNGIHAETIKENFCKYNDVPGCENTLSGQATTGGNTPAAGNCN